MAASKAAQKAIQEALSAFSGTAAEKQGLESFISSLKHSDLPTGWQDNPAIVDAAAKMYQQGGTESPFFKAWGGSPEKWYHGKRIEKTPGPNIRNPLYTEAVANRIKQINAEKKKMLEGFPNFGGTKEQDQMKNRIMMSPEFSSLSREFNNSPRQWINSPDIINEDKFLENNAFNPNRSRDIGIHFGNPEQASKFGEAVLPVYLKTKKPIEVRDIFSNPDGTRLAVDSLHDAGVLKNPEYLASKADRLDSITPFGDRDATSDFYDSKRYKDFWKELRGDINKRKVDSLVYSNEFEGPGKSVAVLSPTQIKSQFNRGTFDPSDPNILKGIGIGAAGLGALTAPNLATAATMQKVNQLGQFDQFAKDMPATNDIPTAMRMAQQYSQRSGIDHDASYKVLQALGRVTPEKGLEEPVWSPIDLAAAPVGAVGALGKGMAMALDAPATYAMDAGLEGLMKLLRGENESSLY